MGSALSVRRPTVVQAGVDRVRRTRPEVVAGATGTVRLRVPWSNRGTTVRTLVDQEAELLVRSSICGSLSCAGRLMEENPRGVVIAAARTADPTRRPASGDRAALRATEAVAMPPVAAEAAGTRPLVEAEEPAIRAEVAEATPVAAAVAVTPAVDAGKRRNPHVVVS